jgi:hypothetical protein
VLLLQQIQHHTVHCLLALIISVYCMCISTTICSIISFISSYSTAFSRIRLSLLLLLIWTFV